MKRVIATIRPKKIEEALDRLRSIGMQNASITKVTGVGPERVEEGRGKMNVELGRYSIEMVRLEFFTPNENVEECVNIVLEAADTNSSGDGIISVSPVEKLVRVNGRTLLN
jgi:nitrogen regulatory protein P-II 1